MEESTMQGRKFANANMPNHWQPPGLLLVKARLNITMRISEQLSSVTDEDSSKFGE
jgi:hypothetical protein